MNIVQFALDWSEVWALIIPLAVLYRKPAQPSHLKAVILYVVVAFFINVFADLISEPSLRHHLPEIFHTNTYLYNCHSIIRFLCFSLFFIQLKQPFLVTLKKAVPIFFLVFTLVYFTFLEKFNNPNHISADFLSTEALILLIYCLLYYLYRLREDSEKPLSGADFYVVTGLSVYVVVNFFVFLFYIPMINSDLGLADSMWNIHNVGYIILCLFLGKAFSTAHAA